MTHLGIDWGEKNIGLAVSDSSGKFVRPLEVVRVNTKTQEHFEKISEVIDQWKVENLVIGLPLGPGGEENSSSKKVKAFVVKLIDYISAKKEKSPTGFLFKDETDTSRKIISQNSDIKEVDLTGVEPVGKRVSVSSNNRVKPTVELYQEDLTEILHYKEILVFSVDFHPEDYTTKQATQGTSRKTKQTKGDALAAEWMLRGYLESLSN